MAGVTAVSAAAWTVKQTGAIDHLECQPLPAEALTAPPAPGHARVAVRAIGLNFADVFAILGLYSATPACPFVPGLEFAGVIEAVSETAVSVGQGDTDVRPWAVGDRVYGVTRFGAYTTHLYAKMDDLRQLPPAWTFEQGCAYPAQALTAIYALKKLGQCRPGETVLVHSAAGGVGLFALQIAQRYGAVPIATVGNERKAMHLVQTYQLPEAQVIVRSGGHQVFKEQLQAALDSLSPPAPTAARREGVDIVLDSLGGDYFQPAYDLLARGGRLVVFGAGSMMPAGGLATNVANWLRLGWQYVEPRPIRCHADKVLYSGTMLSGYSLRMGYWRRPLVDPLELVSANKAVLGFNLIWLWDKRDELEALLRELDALQLPPPTVGRTFPWHALPDALRYFQTGDSIGKVVVTVP